MHKTGPFRRLEGLFFAVLELQASGKKRATSDADNLLKAPLDYVAKLGLIDNDRLQHWTVVGWTDNIERVPFGARLTLISCTKKDGLLELAAQIEKFGTLASGESEGRQ